MATAEIEKTSPREMSLIVASVLSNMSTKLDLEQYKAYWAMVYIARSELRINPEARVFTLPVDDLNTLAGLSGKNPDRLKKNIKEIREVNATLDFFGKDGSEKWENTDLVAGVTVDKIDGRWTITFSFSHIIIDKIIKPGIYTTFNMGSIAKIKKSKYAVILYGLCVDYLSPANPYIAPPTMTIDTFRAYLRLGDQYPLFADIKRFIIEPAIKELNAQTEIDVKCEYITVGKKVTALKFSSKFKEKQALLEKEQPLLEKEQPLLKKGEVEELGVLLSHIPAESRDEVRQLVIDTLALKGFDYCLENIKYAIKTTDGSSPEGLLFLSLKNNYARKEIEKKAKQLAAKEKKLQEEIKKKDIGKQKKENDEAYIKRQAKAMEIYSAMTAEQKAEVDEGLIGYTIGTKAVKLVMYFLDKGVVYE